MVQNLLLGTEDWSFLGAVALRTIVMFVVILGGLRVMGKRGVKHLSVFELGVIVGLGSAAGDPMFYSDVGLLPAFIVFAVVLALYHGLEVLLNRSSVAARKLEGEPIEVLRNGELIPDVADDVEITTAELFAQLRLRSISHLGQVERAIVEPNGEVSVFFYGNDDVKPGLPIIPGLYDKRIETVPARGTYSCAHCGRTVTLQPGTPPQCSRCEHETWTHALTGARIT